MLSEGCKGLGAQTLRLCDEFYTVARATEFHHIDVAMLSIRHAGESLEKFHTAGVFTEDEVKDFKTRLNEVKEHLESVRMPKASSVAAHLADDVGWAMLNKLVECECKAVPAPTGELIECPYCKTRFPRVGIGLQTCPGCGSKLLI